jgi:hypothetical protein
MWFLAEKRELLGTGKLARGSSIVVLGKMPDISR